MSEAKAGTVLVNMVAMNMSKKLMPTMSTPS
jgi:hypothetical protein